MRKKVIIYLSIIMLLLFPVVKDFEILGMESLLALFYLPMRFIYDVIIAVGLKSNIGAWLLLLIMTLAPLGVLFKYQRELMKQKGILFFILMVLCLGLSVGYFSSYSLNDTLHPFVASSATFVLSASMWYLSYFVIFFEVYLKNYKGAKEAMGILSFVIGLAIVFVVVSLGYNIIAVSLRDGSYYSELTFLDYVGALFYVIHRVLLIKLLWFFNDLMRLNPQEWFNPSFMDVMENIKKVSKQLLIYSLYYPILKVLVNYGAAASSNVIAHNISFPFLEVIIALLIIVLSEVLMFGMAYKDENESFV